MEKSERRKIAFSWTASRRKPEQQSKSAKSSHFYRNRHFICERAKNKKSVVNTIMQRVPKFKAISREL
jgi:hypothetical protein